MAFLLENLGIETLILTGVETEICVLATAYHAFNSDYRVVVAGDGTAALEPELGDAALRIIAREVVEKFGDLKKPESVIGTGPFLLERYEPNVKTVFKRHPEYLSDDHVHPTTAGYAVRAHLFADAAQECALANAW